MAQVLNLGQASAIKISATAPTNTKMLWYDTTIVSGVNLKYYDLSTSSWKLLSSSSVDIDDSVTTANKTWSSQKISQEIQTGGKFAKNISVVLTGGKSLGRYTNGQTILSQGKTPEEVMTMIAQETISPSASLSIPSGQREVGGSSAVTLNWGVTKGTNPITSITVNSVSITPTGNSQSGSQAATASTGYGTRTYSVQVSDGILSGSSSAIVRYSWKVFFGNVASKPTNSAQVRSLPNERYDTDSQTFTYNTGTVNKVFCVVLPSNKKLLSVIDKTNLNLNITSQFISEPIVVQDAGSSNQNYTMYVMTTSVAYSNSAVHEVTIGDV